MLDAETVRWVLTGIGGVVMYLWQRSLNTSQKEISDLQVDVQLLKDTRLHKDDFKDFKIELRTQFQDLKEAIKALTPHAS